MNRITALVIFLLVCFQGFIKAQPMNEVGIDDRDSSKSAYGYFNRQLFDIPQFGSWFNGEYDAYKPEKKTLKLLSRKMQNNISIIVVMGTWCSDSRREVPRFYKIADNAGLNPDIFIGIAVNRLKTTGHINMAHLKIERVPTFIVYSEGKELGRIIETPQNSLEKDLLEILKKKTE